MLQDLDATELLFTLQVFVPSLLLVLLLASFLPKSAQEDVPEEEIPGIIPVVLPITLPRTPLLVSLLLLLSLSHAVSFTWMVVAYKLDPPMISSFTAGAGLVAWLGAAYSVWKSEGRRVGWAKAMGWVGLFGEGWTGAVRVWLFVKWTGSFPPGAFPLPSFLLLTLLSVRLLLLVLIIWTLYNPVRDFIPAPRRRNGATSSSSSPSEGERRALLSEGGAVEAGSTASKDGGLGAGGEGGYGTFGESGEEQRIEGRGSSFNTSLSHKATTPAASPLPEPASTESLIPITAASPDNENDNPIDLPPPSLSPVNEHSETSSSPKIPEPILPPTTDDEPTKPSFAEVVAAASSSTEPDSNSSSPPLPTSASLVFPSLPESTEPSRSPSFDIAAPTSLVAPSTPSAKVTSSSPSQGGAHTISPSASSTIESPSVSTKEKRKRLSSLSDMGRKMSDEGKGLVRRVSLMGKSKNSSSSTSIPTLASTENLAVGGAASPSPLNSPAGRSSLSGLVLPEGREGDGTSSFVSNSSSSGGGGLKKRLSLLTRKSSSTVPPAAASSSSSPAEGTGEGASTAGGSKAEKKKFVSKNGRNGKGKKTKSKK